MNLALVVILLAASVCLADSQHYTRNRPGGVGYIHPSHYTNNRRQGRDISNEENTRGQKVAKNRCANCDYNHDAILLKIKERRSAEKEKIRQKRYIWESRPYQTFDETFRRENRHKLPEPLPARLAQRRERSRKNGVALTRRIDEEEDCQCEEEYEDASQEVESMTKADDAISAGSADEYSSGNNEPAFAEPWPADDTDTGAYDENNYDQQDDENNDETTACDEQESSTQETENNQRERQTDSENYKPPEDSKSTESSDRDSESEDQCKCVSIFQCGISYKMGGNNKNDDGSCGEDMVCCPSDSVPPVVPEDNQSKCGFAKPNARVQGTESGPDRAIYGEFPWTVLLTRSDQVHCAGALIHPQIVLTAANCLFNQTLDTLTVRAGAWDLNHPRIKGQPGLIDTYVLHPSFRNLLSLGNNVALLRLGDPYELNDAVNTICLANDINDVDLNNCVATGWGRHPQLLPSDPVDMPEVMKKLRLPYFTRQECQDLLRREYFGKTFHLSSGIFCAGGQRGVDMCTGDGGAPLTCPSRKGGMSQIGFVAGGLGCGKENVPGFYIDVIHYRAWIEENMKKLLDY